MKKTILILAASSFVFISSSDAFLSNNQTKNKHYRLLNRIFGHTNQEVKFPKLRSNIRSNNEHYRSEFEQDKFVNDHYFKDRKGGTFIEIGAHDGVNLSNTWFFEKILGWKGMCIEPRPSAYEKLEKNRNCICIKGAITSKEGYVTFRECKGPTEDHWLQYLSGIESEYPPIIKTMHAKYLKDLNGSYEHIQVYGYVLNSLLKKHKIKSIDFLSIDTEGGELEILKSINFRKYYIYVVLVENHVYARSMEEFMKEKGFKLTKRIGYDDLYVNVKPYQGNLK